MNLLLIDDDELDRQIVIRALQQSPLVTQIVQACSAAEGLKLAAAQLFDAVLLDYRLPDKDGLAVLHHLRSGEFAGVAIIMLSRQEDEVLAEHCLEAGAQDFLLKDEVNARRLARAVRQAKHRFLIETALKSSSEQLRQLSEHDPLTGLANRRGFEMALAAAMAREQRDRAGLAVLLLDLDDFKSVNDTLGHEAGDILLVEVARRLDITVRDADFLCRLGGDEFVVLMTRFSNNEQVLLLAERILSKLQEPILIGYIEHKVTASIGIAIADGAASNAAYLLKYADVAMYRAKQEGRNKSCFYSLELQETVQYKTRMKQDLHKALERQEFQLYYQAQINAHDGALGGVEVLLRWRHPQLGLLSPGAFMSIAEDTGLIIPIGYWVLQEACRQLNQWQLGFALPQHKFKMAVNFSASQIKQPDLAGRVKAVILENQLAAATLEFEITESALIEDVSQLANLLSTLVEAGVLLSLDDFGTGYSSLEHLRLFPISVLKIDKVFVDKIGINAKSEKLLLAIIAFAKALDMQVVAEGVETQQQADFCSRHGCDLLQGYFYSRPAPAEQFAAEFLIA